MSKTLRRLWHSHTHPGVSTCAKTPNLRHGRCTSVKPGRPSWATYEGYYNDNRKHCDCTFTYVNWNRYQGEWSVNKKHCQCTYTFFDTSRREGVGVAQWYIWSSAPIFCFCKKKKSHHHHIALNLDCWVAATCRAWKNPQQLAPQAHTTQYHRDVSNLTADLELPVPEKFHKHYCTTPIQTKKRHHHHHTSLYFYLILI